MKILTSIFLLISGCSAIQEARTMRPTSQGYCLEYNSKNKIHTYCAPSKPMCVSFGKRLKQKGIPVSKECSLY